MILSQLIAATTSPQPVPVHFFTRENLLLFLKFSWLVNRALWPVWAVLAGCLLVKFIVRKAVRRRH